MKDLKIAIGADHGGLELKNQLAEWLREHTPDGYTVSAPKTWKRIGSLREITPCVWNREHTNNACFVKVHPDGPIGAGCHHAGCAGRGWRDLRAAWEPDRRAYTSPENGRSGGRPARAGTRHPEPGPAARPSRQRAEGLGCRDDPRGSTLLGRGDGNGQGQHEQGKHRLPGHCPPFASRIPYQAPAHAAERSRTSAAA